MMLLVIAVLAVFFVWESVYAVIPWTVPVWLQPIIVAGVALAFTWPDWRIALAAAGGVGLLHVLARPAVEPTTMVRPRRGGLPDLPR